MVRNATWNIYTTHVHVCIHSDINSKQRRTTNIQTALETLCTLSGEKVERNISVAIDVKFTFIVLGVVF